MHHTGQRRVQIERDDRRGATRVTNIQHSGWGDRIGKSYYYFDDDFAPRGPYHTEDALHAAMLQPDTLMLEEVVDGEQEASI